MKKYNIKFIGTGTAKEVLDALENLTDGIRSSLENVGTSKGQMPTGNITGKKFDCNISNYVEPTYYVVELTEEGIKHLKQRKDYWTGQVEGKLATNVKNKMKIILYSNRSTAIKKARIFFGKAKKFNGKASIKNHYLS